jgi:hypothetical protein
MPNSHEDDEPIGDIGPSPDRDLDVAGPKTASEYLADVIKQARTHGGWVGVTLATLQPGRNTSGNWPSFKPAVCSYTWGLRGQDINDKDGNQVGLTFGVRTWFSNDIAGGVFYDWQHFAAQSAPPPGPNDTLLRFTPSGTDNVRLSAAALATGVAAWEADSFMFDRRTQQLLFHVPGRGAPLGIMIATLFVWAAAFPF